MGGVFPEELRQEELTKKNFATGLQLIMANLNGEDMRLPRRAVNEAPMINEKVTKVILEEKKVVEPEDMNLKDYVEQLACDNNVTFRPRPRLMHNGKQVYQ